MTADPRRGRLTRALRAPALVRRLPAQIRTAFVAGLTALALCGGGAAWLSMHVYDEVSRTSEMRGTELSVQMADQAAAGVRDVTDDLSGWPVLQIDRTGRVVSDSGGVLDLRGVEALLPPPPEDPVAGRATGWPRYGTLHTGGVDEHERARFHAPDGSPRPGPFSVPGEGVPQHAHEQAHYLSHRTVTVYSTAVRTPAGKCNHPTEPDGSCRSTLYVLVPPYSADEAVAALTTPLAAGVPALALLVATTAWAATRRSLRPVEAIRREVSEITGTSLDRRVPVPEGRDPIRSLAQTTNSTLDHLEDSVDRQARFVADAAHELRSPLAALRYQLETALDHPDSIDRAETLEDALASTRRIHGLTEDLLLLARPEHPTIHSLTDLAGLCRELVHEYEHLNRPVTLKRVPDQAPVRGDGLQLHRLLRNLLDNAVRHARSEVVLDVTDDGGTCTVTVHNDGTALTPDECEWVFERFTRLDEARTRDTGGSGLGLAIARDIAQRHRGTLTAHPTDPAPGTTFTLRIPAAPDTGQPR
ncbi:sensor histidine kinase [Streptomyces sp. NPDC002886]|uniref:sensor histidine kinase n=1 Tax=Streptomyces sp. NPDC002886 TaxID=3364667 RepID=UPI00368A86F1